MKCLVAILLLANVASAQSIYLESKGRTHTVDFDPYQSESRTIHFRVVEGQREIVSDVTVPEGVGSIYIYNPAAKEGAIEYSRSRSSRYYRPWFLVPLFPTFYGY